LTERPPHPVNDIEFSKLIATIRCSVPYTGMIISTRESPKLRDKILQLVVSQISAGSSTEVESYNKQTDGTQDQFTLHDNISLEDVVTFLMKNGYVPSWCTACYRLGRTGAEFMKWAKIGNIHNMCHHNEIQALDEYLIDYAKPSHQNLGWKFIKKELDLSMM
jgi:2-iminoacetate synthase ThiH